MSTTRAPPVEISTRPDTRCKQVAAAAAQLECVSTSASKTDDEPYSIDAIEYAHYDPKPVRPRHTGKSGRALWDPSH